MAFEIYLNNIKTLAKTFGFSDPIELDENLGATFVYNFGDQSVLINLCYDLNSDLITIDTLVAINMPSSRLGLQSLMNQLIGDLLTQNRDLGRLVACPEDSVVKYIKNMSMAGAKADSLASFLPIYVEEAVKWRTKFKKHSPSHNVENKFAPKEIISFETL